MPYLTDEDLVPLADTSHFPISVSASTVRKWAASGVQDARGQMVVLETVRIGGRIYTTKQAITRFIEAADGGRLD